ncbi:MAG TPA: L-fucose/L-arabinose isomerase family protein [Verrucomicrobiota bacterium]|nr:L-fucose/L-arabinose isomerase family protein [Verrucomicrobiota bacterium]
MNTLGIIVGNRGFFPDHLCDSGRKEILSTLEKLGIGAVILPADETKFGSVESLADAEKCANLFKQNADKIDGILVTLPNFGDERAVSNTIRWSGLNVPVLVQAYKDNPSAMSIRDRRDSFCGKMSVCNSLRQYNIPFTLTTLHTVNPDEKSFINDLQNFIVTCRTVKALKGLRVGALGARPAAFNTVRFSEKLFEKYGISVETLDLYELFGWVSEMKDDASEVQAKLSQIKDYVKVGTTPQPVLIKMAKFGVALDKWIKEARLNATAIQCWSAMEQFFGVVPCTIMSMLSNMGMSSACEVDVTGAVAMHVMAKASEKPSAIVDWNNNYGDDPDKGVIFHCSNLPKDIFEKAPVMDYQEIIAGTVGKDNTYGTVVGRLKPTPITYLRISTDDINGKIRAYVGEGELTKDPLKTFGGYGVVKIKDFQKLLRYICENGFEHHVAVNPSNVAQGLNEALSKYLGWDVYLHQ